MVQGEKYEKSRALCHKMFSDIEESGCSKAEGFVSGMAILAILAILARRMNMETRTFKDYLQDMLITYQERVDEDKERREYEEKRK